MAVPATRETLKQYSLRALGKPVIEINVDDDQLEDRIDEACLLYTSPSPRDRTRSRMPSSA